MNYSIHNIKTGFIVLPLLIIVGCNTSGPETESPLTAQVDGANWVADDLAYQRPITLNGKARTILYGISSADGRIALFTTEPIASTGTYEIIDPESDTSLSYYWPQGDEMEEIFYAVSGQVIVEHFGEGEISGSFEMNGENENQNSVEILNGRFESLTNEE